jgi:hypothetical protein
MSTYEEWKATKARLDTARTRISQLWDTIRRKGEVACLPRAQQFRGRVRH